MGEDAQDDHLETLKAIYARVSNERDRLRDARGHFARGLGPAPASAGIATALVAAFGGGKNPLLLGLAAAGLLLMVICSIWYDGKPAYRHLYAKRLGQVPADWLGPQAWYRAMIALEKDIYGDPRDRNRRSPPWADVNDLQDGVDLERTGLHVVQVLWVGVVALLVAAAAV
jgi:hypothetical protein